MQTVVEPELFAVPTDPATPYPVTPDRVCRALADLEIGRIELVEQTLTFDVDGLVYRVSFGPGGKYMSLRQWWEPGLPYRSARDLLFPPVDSWNREHFFPTLFLTENKEGNIRVSGDFLMTARYGMSDLQLNNRLLVAMNVCSEALEYVQWSVKLLREES